MIWQGKLPVFFLASLIVYISASFPLPAPSAGMDDLIGGARIAAFETAPVGPVYLFQERNTCTLASAWKTNLKEPNPGWLATSLYSAENLLSEIRKSFVVDLQSFSPCKSRYFFPFHEFL